MKPLVTLALAAVLAFPALEAQAPQSAPTAAQPFKTAIYVPVSVVLEMKDHAWLESSWAQISSQVHVDHIYLETYRSRVIADDQLIDSLKQFFQAKGIEVSGGICYSDVDNGQFASFDYARPADRDYVAKISAQVARHFDDVILDDFFFANTKSPADIAAKGAQSWTDFRLHEMDVVSRDLVVGAAKAANPNVRMVIKFPNWYEHFAGNGYDLAEEPRIFAGIYAGTETRDPVITDQDLQQYEGYNIVRYFENIDPGHMGGGWVDTYDLRYADRYAEQLWLTVFAKAREMTLFNYIDLLKPADPGTRPWSSTATDVFWPSIQQRANKLPAASPQHTTDNRQPLTQGAPTFATLAGDALDQVRPVVAQLGTPIGISSYRPLHATGEDFLHNFLGNLGIPINLEPTFPPAEGKDAGTILLTEAAKFDPNLLDEIKQHLTAGHDVVITSGLLHALEGKGIDSLVELRYSPSPVLVTSFIGAFGPGAGTDLGTTAKPILFPRIAFNTNDAWPVIRGIADDNLFPLLLQDHYANANLYILTIPDNPADLYRLPEPTLNALRTYLTAGFPVRLDAPARVALFAYDNHTLIVESFRDEATPVALYGDATFTHLKNLQTGEILTGTPLETTAKRHSAQAPLSHSQLSFSLNLPAHSYAAFQQLP